MDADTRLRIDKEIREIGHKIHTGTLREQLELVSEWAVRASDLQAALLRHQPDIVHFSGHGNKKQGIILEDHDGKMTPISKPALIGLFRILKDNIKIVFLNACHSKEQIAGLRETIDFTIAMNTSIGDKAAVIFASYFYQALAFGRSVLDAFELAKNQLELEGIDESKTPELLVRDGANPSKSRIVRPLKSEPVGPLQKAEVAESGDRSVAVSGDMVGATVIVGDGSKITIGGDAKRRDAERKLSLVTFLPRLFAAIAISLAIDVLRRFLGGDSSWSDIFSGILQAVLIALVIIAAVLTVILLLRPTRPFMKKAARLGVINEPRKARRAVALTGIACVMAFGLWLSLPAFAPHYNERGAKFQYSEPPDLSRARESYQQAVRLQPSYAPAHYNLATTYEDLQPDRAIEEYLLAIRYDSQIYPAYNNLARLYILRGKDSDYEQALNILNQAWETSPQEPSVQYSLYKNMGWANYAHHAQPNYLKAEKDLRMAISLQKDKAAAHCLLAYVLTKLGKAEAADECYECVTLAPGEKDIEAKWVSDAQECLMKGDSK